MTYLSPLKRNYRPVWEVLRLFYGEYVGKGEPPSESEWYSWEQAGEKKLRIPAEEPHILWAKDSKGKIFQVFADNKSGNLFHTNDSEIAKDVTHIAKTKLEKR